MAHQIKFELGPVHSSIGSKIGYRHHQPCRPTFIPDARQNRATSQGVLPKKLALRLRDGKRWKERDCPAPHGLPSLLRTASRRDDSIHSEIYDHLAVMVHGMGTRERTNAEARHLHLTK